MVGTSVKFFLILVILPVIIVVAGDDKQKSEEEAKKLKYITDAQKCGDELHPMYEQICAKDKTGNKLAELKKKCVQYPPKLMELSEVIKIFEKCYVPADICDKEKMQTCGLGQYDKANQWYKDNKKDRKEPDLDAIFQAELHTLPQVCEKSKACFKAELEKK